MNGLAGRISLVCINCYAAVRSSIPDCKQPVDVVSQFLAHLGLQHCIARLCQFCSILFRDIRRHDVNCIISLRLVSYAPEELEERDIQDLGIGIKERHLDGTTGCHLCVEYSAKGCGDSPVISHILTLYKFNAALKGCEGSGLVLTVNRFKGCSLAVTLDAILKHNCNEHVFDVVLRADSYPERLLEVKVKRLNDYFFDLNCFHVYPSIVLTIQVTD